MHLFSALVTTSNALGFVGMSLGIGSAVGATMFAIERFAKFAARR